MKKSILSEQFIRMQELAGIKPLYEYPVESYYGWRSTEEEARNQKNTIHYSRDGEYVSNCEWCSHLQAYKGDDKPLNPDEYSHLGEWPKNAKSFGEGDDGEKFARWWVEMENKSAQEKYAQFEEGGKFFSKDGTFTLDPKMMGLETDKEGNIIKYVFSTRAITHNRTM